jgi:hypothetical protein
MRPYASPLLSMILAAMGCGELSDGTACVDVEDDVTECPAAEDVDVADAFSPDRCGVTVESVSGDGELGGPPGGYGGEETDLYCCYDAKILDTDPATECVPGRPYLEGGRALLAPAVARGDWGGSRRPARRDGAAGWTAAALAEHASIAAFAALSLELLAHGAPADLLLGVQRAAADEVVHAQLCFAEASRCGAGPVGPGPLPFTAAVVPNRPLAEVAAAAVREGCLGETLGAALLGVAAERCPDARLARVLRRIARDEERHAALSWGIVAWAVRVGGEEVRAAVRAAFAVPAPRPDVAELALRAKVSTDELAAALAGAMAAVVAPATRAVMAA